jgi:uncharacterized protein YceK
MKNIFILMAVAILVSGCAGFMPTSETATTKAPTATVRADLEPVLVDEDAITPNTYKMINMMEAARAADCDLKEAKAERTATKQSETVTCFKK